MLPAEVKATTPTMHRLQPQAKLPTAPILQSLPATEVKVLRRMLTESAEYVRHELFDTLEVSKLLERPLVESLEAPVVRPDDSGQFNYSAETDPVQALDRESFLFMRFNYCRQQVYKLLQQHAGRRLAPEAIADLLRWERLATETRSELVRGNLPLVIAMAKRTRITGVDLTDLLSDGNLALLRAVNKFDCSRGYRFSTYACRAILKSFSRVATRAARYRGQFPTEFDPTFERGDLKERLRATTKEECMRELSSILVDNVAQLSDVEQKVILSRFAVTRSPYAPPPRKALTLEEVGDLIGVTKERVRQIQKKALVKLRAALERKTLD